VRLYRNIKRGDALEAENLRYAAQMSWFEDDDGSWVSREPLHTRQGAVIEGIGAAMDQLFIEQRNVPQEVSAETSRAAGPTRRNPSLHTRRCMQRMAETPFGAGNVSSGDRYLVNITLKWKPSRRMGLARNLNWKTAVTFLQKRPGA
jgi:hypothetical protein